MPGEQGTLHRVQAGVLGLHQGLAAFVEARMRERRGEDWKPYASRSHGSPPDAPLDLYALLKTMLNNWREVFEPGFRPDERFRMRGFVSMALEARNATAHFSEPIPDEDALRYLDAILQLLKSVHAPADQIEAAKRLYDEQRFAGIAPNKASGSLPDAVEPRQPIGTPREVGQKTGTIEQRILDYIRANPDLDDDELSLRLDIRPRQSINQAARRLESAGQIKRFRGIRGKIVNRATMTGSRE